MSLAALAKLPFVLYFSLPFTFFVLEYVQRRDFVVFAGRALPAAFFLLPPAMWYGWVIPHWQGMGVLKGVFDSEYSAAQLWRFVFDNAISVLPEMLLNYAAVPLFLAGVYCMIVRKSFKNNRFVLLAVLGVLLLAYFFLEINIIANVHDYYLLPFLPLLFMLVGYGSLRMLTSRNIVLSQTAFLLLLLLPLTAYVRMLPRWDSARPGFNRDLLTHKKELREAAPPKALCIAGNDDSWQIFLYHIGKKGWAFNEDRLDAPRLKGMIQEGARYLYSGSRRIDENSEIRLCLDSLILEKGSIRVFRLRR